ncbi:MAG: hypothetical protein PHW83_13505, partial [Bacteroidales bacterium]|nr:hypothetical protein [Bacteroidales bacterium]
VKNSFDDATACAQPFSAGVDFKDGNRNGDVVSKNAEIKLVEVIAPLVLLSGKDTVKDSNRSLTLEDPVYKPAGSIFADKDVYVNVPPGPLHDKVKEEIIEGIDKGAYGAETSVSLADDTSKEAKGEEVIDKKIVNSCEKCNNESNTNPERSNSSAGFLGSRSLFPGQKDETESESTDGIKIQDMCKDISYVTVTPKDGKLCQNTLKTLIASITSIFSPTEWEDCNDENSEGCIKTEDIVIKMSPLFKETNEYMETRSQLVKYPEQASAYSSKYILTNCKVSIGGHLTKVKCAWDMAYLFHERDLAQYDDTGESNTPSERAFEGYLMQEVKTREYTLVDM